MLHCWLRCKAGRRSRVGRRAGRRTARVGRRTSVRADAIAGQRTSLSYEAPCLSRRGASQGRHTWTPPSHPMTRKSTDEHPWQSCRRLVLFTPTTSTPAPGLRRRGRRAHRRRCRARGHTSATESAGCRSPRPGRSTRPWSRRSGTPPLQARNKQLTGVSGARVPLAGVPEAAVVTGHGRALWRNSFLPSLSLSTSVTSTATTK